MAQTRMIRTKIRATEEEARRLHEIAERQNIYIAKLIRECTLAPSMKRLVEIKISDVNDFSSSVSALEICMGNAFHLLQGSSSMFSGDMVIMKSMLKEIDENYVKLRKRVLEKRKVYGAFAAVCLSRLKLERAVEQQTEMSKNRYGISVSVTEDEINIIRKKAKEKGCSISTLLKQNVFIMYQNGMFTVNCDDLTELNNRLNRMIAGTKGIWREMDILSAGASDTFTRWQTLKNTGIRIIGKEPGCHGRTACHISRFFRIIGSFGMSRSRTAGIRSGF